MLSYLLCVKSLCVLAVWHSISAQEICQRDIRNSTTCIGDTTCPNCVQISWKEKQPYIYEVPELNEMMGIYHRK